jgi:O-antigen/teichoic acid export membrane protein
MVADLNSRGANERLAELVRVCTKWRIYACTPIFLVILFASADLVKFLYGTPYAAAAMPLVILSAGQLFAVIAGNGQITLYMTGRQKTVFVIVLLTLLFNVLLNFALVPRFGLMGAAGAAAISAIVLNVSASVAVWKYWNISVFEMRYAKSFGAALFACGVLYGLRPLEVGAPLVRLFIVAIIGATAFAGGLIALGLDAEDWEVLDLIRAQLRQLLFSESR